jgi:diguanylate cyclase (GGDEF)-like protein/PAS domain S-box-containing protein
MSEMHAVDTQDNQQINAYDRPAGQLEVPTLARPEFRPATKWFVASSVVLTLTIWIGFYVRRGALPDDSGLIWLLLFAFAVASARIPLIFAYQQEIEFNVTVVVLAILLLPPHLGMSAVVGGYVLGYGLRYRFRYVLDCPHNASIHGLGVGLTSLVLAPLGSNLPPSEPSIAGIVGIGATAALITIVLVRVLDAVVISLESRQSFRQVLTDSTLGMQSGEQAVLGAMIALGIMGAVMARVSPWALLLLLVPAFALWLALRQNVETRHRIEASLATAQRVARIGSLDWDLRRGDMRWSEILFQILEYDQDETQPTTETYLAHVHDDDRPHVLAAFHAAAEGRPVEIDHRVVLESGQERAFNVKFNSVLDRRGRVKRVVGTVHDVTERKLLEQRLEFQAFHDPLTLLPNRAMFMRRLEQSFARYHRTGSIALLFLDLDRFKLINDTMGHDSGDELLRMISGRLRTCIRPNDVVARLGGDEFIVLLDRVASDEDATVVADRIVAAVGEPVTLLGSRDVVVSTSIGIVRPTPEHTSGADLLRDADTALYRAKEMGKNRYVLFDRSMGVETEERLILEEALRTAIPNGELSLVFQPRIDLATGDVVIVEALVRWTHPTRGEIPPGRFIPIAEETGQIEPIGRWILQAAISEAATWGRVVNPAPALSINITSRQLHDPEFAAALANQIFSAGLTPGQVRLEVPESTVMKNVDGAIAALGRLQQMGARVAIDDFGSGHSSLTSLRRLPVDTLQLDRQFVAEIGSNREATTVAKLVIGLAHGLGLRVVAAGIERAEQVDELIALGCELAQGNHFCAPVPGPELLAYLIRSQQSSPEGRRPADPPNVLRIKARRES